MLSISVIVTSLVFILLVIIIILFRLKSSPYNNLVKQNLKVLQFEKQLERDIINISESEVLSGSNTVDVYQNLDLRLQKFMVEERPYLWSA
ncbi:MAG: hypothetical protein K8R53_02170 [Bacteroidales bacterium]|nr:hypothetical protein [Bacteroidales bacterium]